MREEYVNAFLVPAVKVWEQELRMPLRISRTGVDSLRKTAHDLTVAIEVSGAVKGMVYYGISMNDGRALSRALLRVHGMRARHRHTIMGPSQMAESAIGEIANVISGNATAMLEEAGLPCRISPPSILKPKGTRFPDGGTRHLIAVFHSRAGILNIRIRLDEAAAAAA